MNLGWGTLLLNVPPEIREFSGGDTENFVLSRRRGQQMTDFGKQFLKILCPYPPLIFLFFFITLWPKKSSTSKIYIPPEFRTWISHCPTSYFGSPPHKYSIIMNPWSYLRNCRLILCRIYHFTCYFTTIIYNYFTCFVIWKFWNIKTNSIVTILYYYV